MRRGGRRGAMGRRGRGGGEDEGERGKPSSRLVNSRRKKGKRGVKGIFELQNGEKFLKRESPASVWRSQTKKKREKKKKQRIVRKNGGVQQG